MSNKAIPATVSEIMIYKAQGDTDTTEGRGPRRTIGHFADETVAKKAAKGQGVFGSDGYVEGSVFRVAIFHDTETGHIVTHKLGPEVHIEFEDISEIKAKALAKLTVKEKKALGLK